MSAQVGAFFCLSNGQRLVRCVRGLRSTFRLFGAAFIQMRLLKGGLYAKV